MRFKIHAVVITGLMFFAAQPARATTPYHAITVPTSTLSQIAIGNDLSNQLHTPQDTNGEVYPPGAIPADASTFVAMNGVLYTSDFSNHNGTATGNLGAVGTTRVVYTPVSQTATTGLGTVAAPYQIVTVVALGTTGVTITQTDSYITGRDSYSTSILISNTGTVARNMIVYVGNDCFLSNSDSNFGYFDPVTGLVACAVNMGNTPPGRIEAYQPVTAGSHHFEGFYADLWAAIATKLPFNDTIVTTRHDDGMGLSWNVSVNPLATTTIQLVTTFSTLGHVPLTTLKTADTATVTPGARDGYTITINNPNTSSVTLSSISDTLPAGFTYRAASSSGVTTTDPTINGQTLTWSGSFLVVNGSSVTLHFGVVASTSTGAFFNNAGGVANNGYTVAATGNTAKIFVTNAITDGGVGDSGPPADGNVNSDGGGGMDGHVNADGGGGMDGGGMMGDGGNHDGGGMMGDGGGPADAGAPADTGVAEDTGVPDDTGVAADGGGTGNQDGATPIRDSGTGTGGGRDATGGDGARVGADTGNGSSGCSCSTAETPSGGRGSWLAWALLGLVALPLRRIRRKR